MRKIVTTDDGKARYPPPLQDPEAQWSWHVRQDQLRIYGHTRQGHQGDHRYVLDGRLLDQDREQGQTVHVPGGEASSSCEDGLRPHRKILRCQARDGAASTGRSDARFGPATCSSGCSASRSACHAPSAVDHPAAMSPTPTGDDMRLLVANMVVMKAKLAELEQRQDAADASADVEMTPADDPPVPMRVAPPPMPPRASPAAPGPTFAFTPAASAGSAWLQSTNSGDRLTHKLCYRHHHHCSSLFFSNWIELGKVWLLCDAHQQSNHYIYSKGIPANVMHANAILHNLSKQAMKSATAIMLAYLVSECLMYVQCSSLSRKRSAPGRTCGTFPSLSTHGLAGSASYVREQSETPC